MRRAGPFITLILAIACVVLPIDRAGAQGPPAREAAPKRSPTEVVQAALEALHRGRVETVVKSMHPEALEAFRVMMLDLMALASREGKDTALLGTFQGVRTVDELKGLDGGAMLAAWYGHATSTPEARKLLATARIEPVGRILEGTDKAYVVYRSRVKLGPRDVVRVEVVSLRRSGPEWKMMIQEELADDFATMRRAVTGENTLPDIRSSKVEPVGIIREGRQTAMVVYRSTTPDGGGAPLVKLAVLAVPATDPAFGALRKDDLEAARAAVEKHLGVRKPPSPEEQAARQAEIEERLEARKAEVAARRERVLGPASRRPRPGMPAATGGRSPSPSESEVKLPDGLVGVPDRFLGGNRDHFAEIAPAGGVLVGVRVSTSDRFGGPKISSVQPVFRVGEKLVDGQRHGRLNGKEIEAIARGGYAVGAMNTRTGLTLDGFGLVFMRVDGGRLDASDSYNSPWLGDSKGGNPREVSGEGKVPVGLQGRAGQEVNALGLIVKE